ncbi:potassium channel family protein [Halomonas organivorans]|uniref:Voltage-gated potassium channel n=1 Tax=Halomonas organivorans TaxID=257772 RepID=A0A7W5BUI9_9GAMM|nr:potassium channel family protein [Halomonas organivorans]MBB3139375.1 voltage-gated potassium channel [Halomonas organivorans]
MPVILRLLKALKASMFQVSWSFLLFVTLGHLLLSWLAMVVASEEVASSPIKWLYFYITTASTVGYGDYSPVTAGGQLVAALWLIPGGIAIFAALIGKATMTISTYWRHLMEGKSDYRSLTGHTLVIGWHGETTRNIINILRADTELPDDIVLCVCQDISNPMPGDIKFVRGESFASADLLQRAGVTGASRIIIYDDSDERVATIALSVYPLKSSRCHIVAHCGDPHTADMLRRTLPGIECTEALAIEMLVRSSTDAGISRVVNELLSVTHGATQYQACLPAANGMTYGELFTRAKRQCDVTLLGISDSNEDDGNLLNPPGDVVLQEGDVIFYMGNKRLSEQELVGLLAPSDAVTP